MSDIPPLKHHPETSPLLSGHLVPKGSKIPLCEALGHSPTDSLTHRDEEREREGIEDLSYNGGHIDCDVQHLLGGNAHDVSGDVGISPFVCLVQQVLEDGIVDHVHQCIPKGYSHNNVCLFCTEHAQWSIQYEDGIVDQCHSYSYKAIFSSPGHSKACV